MVLMPLLSRLLTLLVILTMPLFLARLTLIPIKSLSIDRKIGSAGMPRPISYAVFCLKKKKKPQQTPTANEIRQSQRKLPGVYEEQCKLQHYTRLRQGCPH